MFSQGLRLLLLSIAGWARARALEIAIVVVAAAFFAVAFVLGSVALHQALVPEVGLAWATAIVAGCYLLLGAAALLARQIVRRRRLRIARATNWAGAIPKPTPALMLAALAAGAMLGSSPRRR